MRCKNNSLRLFNHQFKGKRLIIGTIMTKNVIGIVIYSVCSQHYAISGGSVGGESQRYDVGFPCLKLDTVLDIGNSFPILCDNDLKQTILCNLDLVGLAGRIIRKPSVGGGTQANYAKQYSYY